jgi:hypothetical protein
MALALDKGTDKEESRTAAITALTLIRKHRLLFEPEGDLTPEPEPPRPSSPLSAEMSVKSIRNLADDQARKLVSELVRKSILGGFPLVSAASIAEAEIKAGHLLRKHRKVFLDQLRKTLNAKVNRGVLVSKSGYRGGYQLAQTKKAV